MSEPPQFCRRPISLFYATISSVIKFASKACLASGGWDISDRFKQSAIIEPVGHRDRLLH